MNAKKQTKIPYDSGRKSSKEWNDVDDVYEDGKRNKNKCACKHCGLVLSAKIERIRTYLGKTKFC